jgi:GntR family carbon starvation induced transcriptional regulator
MVTTKEKPAAVFDQKEGKTDRAPSLSETAFRIIRQQILRGEIPPGEKLKIEVLQREHSLSSSPLREALNRLVTEKLVVADDHRGFRAASMSIADLQDITDFRLIIEPEALGQSIANGTDDWEAGAVAAYHRYQRVRERIRKDKVPLNDEWTARHKEFHMALLSAAPSSRLLSTCSSLFDQAERYRRFSASNRKQPRDTDAEHLRLMEATIARKADLAVALLREHIALTTQNVIALQQAK